MSYTIKEIFLTLQGEGAQAGRRAVFCRFAGCNLWSGREEDRAGAQCTFCDTEFVGTHGTLGGRYVIDITIQPVAGTVRFPSVERFVQDYVGGSPLSVHVAKVSDETRAALLSEVSDALMSYTAGDAVAFPIEAHLASAKK